MCSPSNQSIVETVIDELSQQGKPFTAFDITQEARKRGANEFHNQMKGAVHGKANSVTGYQRQLIQIPGSPVDPWLYFPQGYNPQDYIDAIAAGNVPPAGNAQSAVVSQPAAADPDDDDDTATLTSENRLAVPTDMLKDIGANTHDTVYAVAIPNAKKIELRLDIGPSGVDPANSVTEYDTGKKREVRISKRVLNEANLDGVVFKITANNGIIEITA